MLFLVVGGIFDWVLINLRALPELLLSLGVLILVVYGLKRWIGKLSTALLIFWAYHLTEEAQVFMFMGGNGLLLTGSWGGICKGLLVIACIWLLLVYRNNERGEGDSWILLGLILLVGSFLLVSSVNWVMLYLALEFQSLIVLILVAKGNSAYGTEAGLKYLVLGAVSSGLFLFGCALLYGVSGETSVPGIKSVLMGDVGMIFILVSLLFKLSVAPFHMWAPDVYEGAPTVTTALLTTIPKIGVYFVLAQVGLVSNVVLFCGVVSIIYGGAGAINQTKMKRLLAYSGIGHMGFIILGVGQGSFEGIQASLMYLSVYIVMSVCVFSALVSLKFNRVLIIEVSSLSRENSVIAWTLGLTFLSTAGIPPLAGFLGKWWVLLSGVSRGYIFICMAVVMASVIAGVYYVRVVRIIYFTTLFWLAWQKAFNGLEVIKLRQSMPLGVSIFLVLFLMMSPNWVLQMTHDATIGLYI